MIKVLISKQSNYPVKSSVVKKKLAEFLAKNGIVSDTEVSIALVGEKKMLEIQKRYLREDPFSLKLRGTRLHNVLSFVPTEGKGSFVYPPDGKIQLGEIIVCYPEAVKEAKAENVLVDEKVYKLVEHGANHLLGKHHEDEN
jgi:rRNA maturation RNase YbeY